MLFTRSFLLALAGALSVVAQSNGPNPFTYGEGDQFQATAGEPVTITWDPTTEGTISLILRNGAASNLEEGSTIAENIPNSGSYTWTPDADITRGSDYALQIVDDADPSQVNYSPFFVIESDNTVATNTGVVSLAAPTESLDLPSALPTASPSMFPNTMTSTTATESSSESTTATSSSTRSSGTASTTSNGDLQATTSAEGGAARATAMAGMLGAVALGIIAL